jgi:integrase
MGELNSINNQLSRVSIREKKGNLYIRGMFPSDTGLIRREFSLKCKNNPQGRKAALIKAKEIDYLLLSGQWEQEEKNNLTVEKAIAQYTIHYWNTREKTPDRIKNWQKEQEYYWGYLPQDETFNAGLIKRVLESLEGGSYKQKKMSMLLSPLARYHGIDFNFAPYKKYQSKSKSTIHLPKPEDIIGTINSFRYEYHRITAIVLLYYGLRPHELFRSKIFLNQTPITLVVGERTKTQSRTVYPIEFQDSFDYLDLLRVAEVNCLFLSEYYDRFIKTTLTNRELGGKVSRWFSRFPFSPYQLRHYYAVRGAVKGISPVVMSKWMGHSLTVHYKHYGSLIGDLESEKLWSDVFSK